MTATFTAPGTPAFDVHEMASYYLGRFGDFTQAIREADEMSEISRRLGDFADRDLYDETSRVLREARDAAEARDRRDNPHLYNR